jgi:excisionase family DNA binding protein
MGTVPHMQTQPYSRERTLLTVNDLAAILRVSRSTVYLLVRDGLLHPVRLGGSIRFLPEDVESYIERLPKDRTE